MYKHTYTTPQTHVSLSFSDVHTLTMHTPTTRTHSAHTHAREHRLSQRFIYSVFTKDTLDEKGQARDTSTHVTFNALNSTKNSPLAAG